MPNATLTRRRAHTFSTPALIFSVRITIISRFADPGVLVGAGYIFFLDVRTVTRFFIRSELDPDPVFSSGVGTGSGFLLEGRNRIRIKFRPYKKADYCTNVEKKYVSGSDQNTRIRNPANKSNPDGENEVRSGKSVCAPPS